MQSHPRHPRDLSDSVGFRILWILQSARQLVVEAAATPLGGSAPFVQGRLEVGERGAGRPLSPASDRDDRPAPAGEAPRAISVSARAAHPGFLGEPADPSRGHGCQGPSVIAVPSFPGPDMTSVCRHCPQARRGHGSHQQGSSVTKLQGFSADSPSGAALSL